MLSCPKVEQYLGLGFRTDVIEYSSRPTNSGILSFKVDNFRVTGVTELLFFFSSFSYHRSKLITHQCKLIVIQRAIRKEPNYRSKKEVRIGSNNTSDIENNTSREFLTSR